MIIKSKEFCPKKQNYRIAFKTRGQADNFIENYADYFGGNTELKPVRSFYCPSCNRWHVTHFPLKPEMQRAEERDCRIQELQQLASRIRTEFRKTDWEAWKPAVEEGVQLLEMFREKPGFEKLMEETEPQIQHCAAIIRTTEAKETGAANDEFKLMRKSVEPKAKALDYEGFEQGVRQLVSHFRDDCLRKALMPANKEYLTAMTICLEDGETMDIVRGVMELAAKSVPDSRDIEADELYDQVLNMTVWMDKLFVLGLPRKIWDILQSKVKKIASVLEWSFGGHHSPDGFPLMEKVRIVANERMIDDAAICINEGDKELALEVLQLVDARMSQLSFSKKKVELMKEICRLGEELF